MKISQCNRIVVVIIPEHLEDFTVSNGMQSWIRDLEFMDGRGRRYDVIL